MEYIGTVAISTGVGRICGVHQNERLACGIIFCDMYNFLYTSYIRMETVSQIQKAPCQFQKKFGAVRFRDSKYRTSSDTDIQPGLSLKFFSLLRNVRHGASARKKGRRGWYKNLQGRSWAGVCIVCGEVSEDFLDAGDTGKRLGIQFHKNLHEDKCDNRREIQRSLTFFQ